jgi:hypothetical protein
MHQGPALARASPPPTHPPQARFSWTGSSPTASAAASGAVRWPWSARSPCCSRVRRWGRWGRGGGGRAGGAGAGGRRWGRWGRSQALPHAAAAGWHEGPASRSPPECARASAERQRAALALAPPSPRTRLGPQAPSRTTSRTGALATAARRRWRRRPRQPTRTSSSRSCPRATARSWAGGACCCPVGAGAALRCCCSAVVWGLQLPAGCGVGSSRNSRPVPGRLAVWPPPACTAPAPCTCNRARHAPPGAPPLGIWPTGPVPSLPPPPPCRRAAPAGGHRARTAQGLAHHHPGRGHQRAGHGLGAAGAAGSAAPGQGAHGAGHRAQVGAGAAPQPAGGRCRAWGLAPGRRRAGRRQAAAGRCCLPSLPAGRCGDRCFAAGCLPQLALAPATHRPTPHATSG